MRGSVSGGARRSGGIMARGAAGEVDAAHEFQPPHEEGRYHGVYFS